MFVLMALLAKEQQLLAALLNAQLSHGIVTLRTPRSNSLDQVHQCHFSDVGNQHILMVVDIMILAKGIAAVQKIPDCSS